MADVVVNGVTYSGVNAVTMQDAEGNTTTFYPDAVRYNAQTLTDEQKAQARANIGAAAEGGGGGTSVQPDWNQTDSSAADFIKHKPFGDSEAFILPEQEVPYDPEQQACVAILDGEINSGDTITVVYDGVSYICNTMLDEETGGVLFGNLSFMGVGNDTGEPFAGFCIGNTVAFLPIDTNSHVIGIISRIVKKLSAEYMEVRTFYVNLANSSDPYIYTDAMCTTKATKEEVIATAKVQNFRLVMVLGGVELIAAPVLSVPVYLQDDFRIHAYDAIRDEEIKIYRTAEYVPETTT